MHTLIHGHAPRASYRPAPSQESQAPAGAAFAFDARDDVAAHYLGCLAQRQALERQRAASFFQHVPTR